MRHRPPSLWSKCLYLGPGPGADCLCRRGDASQAAENSINLFPPGKMVSLRELEVTPQTVFIPIIRPLLERPSKHSASHASPLDSRRSSLHRPPTRQGRTSTGTPTSLSNNVDMVETLQPVSAGSSPAMTGIVHASPEVEKRNVAQSSTAASLHSGHDDQQRPAYAKSSLSRLSVGTTELAVSKAVPEVSAVRTVAVGRMESTADMHTEDGASTPGSGTETPNQPHPVTQRHVPAATAPFVSSYEGRDPGTLGLLQHVHLEIVRTSGPLIELGPYISAIQPKRRSANKAVARPPDRAAEPTLLASLDIHHSPVVAIITSPDNLFFATCSANGSVNIWDVSRLERSVSSKPRLSYQVPCQRIYAATIVKNTHCIAIATDEGFEIIRVFTSSANGHRRYSRVDRVRRYQSKADEGHLTCIEHFKTSDGTSCVLAGTANGVVISVDLRTMLATQRVQLNIAAGKPAAIAADGKHTWVAVATSGGWLSVVDLRFAVVLRDIAVGASITACELHPASSDSDCLVTVAVEIEKAEENRKPAQFQTLLKTYDISSGEIVQAWGTSNSAPALTQDIQLISATAPPATPASTIAAIMAQRPADAPSTYSAIAQHLQDGTRPEAHTIRALLKVTMPLPSAAGLSKPDLAVSQEPGKWFLTAGDDRIIRAWQLDQVSQSMIVTGASRGIEARYR